MTLLSMCKAMALITVSLCVFGCIKTYIKTPASVKAYAEREHKEYMDIVNNIVYVKDARTGLCFAYTWGGMANGGPALATVPCDKVDKYLK